MIKTVETASGNTKQETRLFSNFGDKSLATLIRLTKWVNVFICTANI